jgi:hypothetical protein
VVVDFDPDPQPASSKQTEKDEKRYSFLKTGMVQRLPRYRQSKMKSVIGWLVIEQRTEWKRCGQGLKAATRADSERVVVHVVHNR